MGTLPPVAILCSHERHVAGNEIGCSAAASAHDVDESFVDKLLYLRCHGLRCLVVESHGVGQSGVGVSTNIIRCVSCQFCEIGFHLPRPERAVETDGKDGIGTDRCEKCAERLPRECSSGLVADGHREHDGQCLSPALHHVECSADGHLGVERVEDGLDEQRVDAPLHESVYLLVVCCEELVVGELAPCRVAHVGRHRAGLVCRSYRPCHISWLLQRAVGVGRLSCQPCCLQVHLAAAVLGVVVALRDALCIEGVGGDDVGASTEVALVYIAYYIGTCQ